MMESVAAIALAANIVEFLEFGRKLISGTLELYRSDDGASSSNRILYAVTEDLGKLCRDLSPRNGGSSRPLTDAETSLAELTASCNQLGQEFLQRLESLKVHGTKKRWRSIGQLLKGLWHAEEVAKYEKQLDHYRSQIAARLLMLLG